MLEKLGVHGVMPFLAATAESNILKGFLKPESDANFIKEVSEIKPGLYPRAILKFCPPSSLDYSAHH